MGRVIAGDYSRREIWLPMFGKPFIRVSMFKKVIIDKSTVESYELQNEGVQIVRNSSRMFTKDKYRVAINFKDGKRSLIEVDDRIFKAIQKELF